MKLLFSIIILAAISMQSFRKVFILVDYQLNKEYITAKFCVNKNKPQSCCEGKCHMRKKMAKEEQRDNSPLNNLKDKAEIQLFSEFSVSLKFSDSGSLIIPTVSSQEKISNLRLFSVFHPPKV